MPYKLVIVEGQATRSEIPVEPPLTIGRSPQAGLTINHPSVSRVHCEITEQEGALVVRDNKSANGTFINGEQITRRVLRMGDTLTVGPLTFGAIYKHAGAYPRLGDH